MTAKIRWNRCGVQLVLVVSTACSTLHQFSYVACMSKYLAINSGGYLLTSGGYLLSCINCSMLNGHQRS